MHELENGNTATGEDKRLAEDNYQGLVRVPSERFYMICTSWSCEIWWRACKIGLLNKDYSKMMK